MEDACQRLCGRNNFCVKESTQAVLVRDIHTGQADFAALFPYGSDCLFLCGALFREMASQKPDMSGSLLCQMAGQGQTQIAQASCDKVGCLLAYAFAVGSKFCAQYELACMAAFKHVAEG